MPRRTAAEVYATNARGSEETIPGTLT